MVEGPDGLTDSMGVGDILLLGASNEIEDVLLGHDLGGFFQAPARVRALAMRWHANHPSRHLVPELLLGLKAVILKM